MIDISNREVVADPDKDPERIKEEIAYMEARLADIGHDGDSAYEKAMIKFYCDQVARRKEMMLHLAA